MVLPAMLAEGVGGNGNTSCGFNDGQPALVVSVFDMAFSLVDLPRPFDARARGVAGIVCNGHHYLAEGLPMARAYNVIDADGHILEPLDLWDKYIDPEFRER